MRVIVDGSPDINDIEIVDLAIQASGFQITQLLVGNSWETGKLAARWALDFEIPVRVFPDNWFIYRDLAPLMRNSEMLKQADAVIVIGDPKWVVCADLVRRASDLDLKLFKYEIKD